MEPLPSLPVAPVGLPGVVIVGAVIVGAVIVGAGLVGVVMSPGAAPAGATAPNEANVEMRPSAKIAPVAQRRRIPELPFRDFVVTKPRRVGDAQRRTVRSRSCSSIAFHGGV